MELRTAANTVGKSEVIMERECRETQPDGSATHRTCHLCHGRRMVPCGVCGGDGTVPCGVCRATGMLLFFLELDIVVMKKRVRVIYLHN